MIISSHQIVGDGRGKKLSVPTINLSIPAHLTIPHGIYAGWLFVVGQKLPAAVHYGPRPTYNDSSPSLEAHLLVPPPMEYIPYDGALITLEFVKKIRDVLQFADSASMMLQIKKDIDDINTILDTA